MKVLSIKFRKSSFHKKNLNNFNRGKISSITCKIESVPNFTSSTNLQHLFQVKCMAFKEVSGMEYFVKKKSCPCLD